MNNRVLIVVELRCLYNSIKRQVYENYIMDNSKYLTLIIWMIKRKKKSCHITIMVQASFRVGKGSVSCFFLLKILLVCQSYKLHYIDNIVVFNKTHKIGTMSDIRTHQSTFCCYITHHKHKLLVLAISWI